MPGGTTMRVADNVLTNRLLTNLWAADKRQGNLQEQLSSGRALLRPSDDPAKIARALRFRANQVENGQYQSNIQDARNWLENVETVVRNVVESLQRARDMAIQGATDTNTAEARNALATELLQIKAHLIELGNTNFDGRYMFGGHQTLSVPFDTATGNYLGDTLAADIVREIAPGVKMVVNYRGDQLFPQAPDPTSAITVVDQLATDLQANNRAAVGGADLTNLDAGLDSLLAKLAEVGAKIHRLDMEENRLKDQQVSLASLQSNVEDVDVADAALKLAVTENAYKVALSAAGRIIQPTLLDFLR